MRNRVALVSLLSLFLLGDAARAAVTGVVMNREGVPIAGARVTLHAMELPDARRVRLLSVDPTRPVLVSAECDSKGAFKIESPKDAIVEMQVTAAGYAPWSDRIEHDQYTGAIALRAAPAKSGTITSGGKPLAGVTVSAIALWAEVITKTDAAGRYTLPDPKEWAQRIVFIHPDHALNEEFAVNQSFGKTLDRSVSKGVTIKGRAIAADGRTALSQAPLFVDDWPVGVTGEDGAFTLTRVPVSWNSIEARAGNVRAFRSRGAAGEVVLKGAAAATLAGLVLDAKTRQPLAGAVVQLSSRAGIRSHTLATMTNAKGVYSLTARPASYELLVSHPAFEFRSETVNVSSAKRIDKNVSGSRLARVIGTVMFEDKVPVAAALLREDALQDGSGMAGPLGPAMMMRRMNPVFSGPDGRFAISIAGDRDVEIRSAKKGYPDAKSSQLKLVAGERKSGIVITVPRGLAVAGRVIDGNGQGLGGVRITSSEAGEDQGMMMRRQFTIGGSRNDEPLVESGSDGAFTMNLKEGTWDLVFRREGYAVRSVRAHRVARDAAPLEVTMDPGVEISGRVVRSGAGIEGVRVNAFSQTIGDAQGATDASGYFTLSDLAPGSYMLAVTKLEEGIRENRNAKAPTRDLVVDLPQGGRITGRVIDKTTRRPIPSFQAGVSMSRSGGGMAFAMPPMMHEFTSDDGTFTLENVAPGSNEINVTAPGYVRGRMSGVNVEDGKTVADLEIALDTGARVTGRVTNGAGSPVAEARVGIATASRNPAMMMRGGASATTDASGEYLLESVETGSNEIFVEHAQYVSARKTVEVSGKEARADFRLDSGLRVSGQVVTDSGVPVADAFVNSNSAAGTGANRSTRTDGNGNFSFDSLPSGRYTFNASRSGFANGVVRDIDIASSGPVKITLSAGASIYGRVTGLSDAEMRSASVTATGNGGRASAPIDSTGSYRINGAPTGSVQVGASSGGFSGNKSSGVKSVEVETGGSLQVDLDFRNDVVVTGRVTRNGTPAANTRVMFNPEGGSARPNASATTDDAGTYSVAGLEDGRYSVIVVDMQRLTPFSTKHEVRGSGTFDIELPTAQVRGRVVDASTSQGLDDVRIELRTSTAERFGMGRSATTSNGGSFSLDSVAEGSYRVIAEKAGYASGAADAVVTSSGGEVEVRMTKADGANVRLVDARGGSGLSGRIYVSDLQERFVLEETVRTDGAESQRLALSAGQYIARVWASGYAARTVLLSAPGQMNIALTPGGSIEIASTSATPREARLLDDAGRVYYLFGRMRSFTIDGAVATLRSVAPGNYTLQLFDSSGAVTGTKQLSVLEGQVARISI